MVTISMTTFVDFVLKSGIPQLTFARKAKQEYQNGYHPTRDHYKQLREYIVTLHENHEGKDGFDKFLSGLTNQQKVSSYPVCIEGYKRWWGRKNIEWTGPTTVEWTYDRLIVRVNPELGVLIDGQPHIIKLYFKSDKPSKSRLETMFHLLQHATDREPGGTKLGILDVRRGHLYSASREVLGIEQLLAGQAAAFQTMWDQV